MARPLTPYELAVSRWTSNNAYCPICNNLISSWYCPNCGIPINNSAYGTDDNNIYYKCGINHFKPNTSSEYQLCSNCLTPNPYNAKYCRNCREEIYLHAKDKEGHGWIDLGLSVLWSTAPMDGFYRWNNSEPIYDEWSYRKTIDGKDAATMRWGEKWRTPTKDEFEELLNKCKWEKYISLYGTHALKATGPNGNSIFLYTKDSIFGWNSLKRRNGDDSISFWTSSKGFKSGSSCPVGYAFVFTDMELHRANELCTLTSEERRRLWLENPIKWRDEKDICSNVRLMSMSILCPILPVADKKWQGRL